MTTLHVSKSAQIRAHLDHPVIDSDGHTIENSAVLAEYIKSEGGSKMAEQFTTLGSGYGLVIRGENLTEARDRRATCGPWWGIPAANTLDRATAMLPKLLYERLHELGLDYSVLYTTIGLSLIGLEDADLRRASCRALNRMRADMTAKELGMKSAMMASYVKRPIPMIARNIPMRRGSPTLSMYMASTAITTMIRFGLSVRSSA